MLSKACSLTILSSFNTCNTILGSSVPLKRCIGSLVLGQYENGSLTKNTLSAIEVAKGYGSVSLWLCDLSLTEQKCSELARNVPVAKIYLSAPNVLSSKLPENRCHVLQSLLKENAFDFVCGCSTADYKSLLARFSAVTDIPMLTDVFRVVDQSTFQRFVYAGNVVETVQVSAKPIVMTIRSSSFIVPTPVESNTAEVIPLEIPVSDRYSTLDSETVLKSDRPDLVTASRVVVGGRGVGSKEEFQKVYALADKLGAAVGGTRAAVDLNMLESNLQVGQTGKVIAPSLYIGLGVSGSIQHQAGMKESQTIVCINKDPEAPLFGIADYGIVGDLHILVPEILSKL
ncbi:electron transfer flavoprotein alpha-subunit [Blastocystis sp. subtype 4]|uniref:electron transfer flavoprotein alpha-subunit n=1 Tax=Blastocystis sp. subtype 4 TaxID=944170 RepID=UPI0007116511|nr:electron transfer flavoprotein alpha-subunit [Blastocystis sp. subtype 4]KNB41577.1 electron transfer flavoprotein alpha-subunit [Blastocystis sp. subtype 4]|eukprot:XP_014525020.1 electron transfer flavoprotein alpha-subunit [Blastocystis sp. subtype 4]